MTGDERVPDTASEITGEVALADSIGLDPTVTEPASARRVLGRQLGTFAVIGIASTLLNLVLFALFRQAMSNQVANALALVICTVLNTAANRRFTFGAGRASALGVQLRSLVLLLITWGATAGALWALHRFAPHADTLAATLTVAAGNAVATAVRFVALRRWFAQ